MPGRGLKESISIYGDSYCIYCIPSSSCFLTLIVSFPKMVFLPARIIMVSKPVFKMSVIFLHFLSGRQCKGMKQRLPKM